MSDAPPEAHSFNRSVISEFRANGGTVSRYAGMGIDLLILHHTGAKSGKAYESPVAYTRDGNGYVIVASKGGAPDDPQWYRNLLAKPDVEIEVGTERLAVTAEPTAGAERERLFDAHATAVPQFREYLKKTTRTMPVVVLTPR